jgi:pyruvate carboxylase subunit B
LENFSRGRKVLKNKNSMMKRKIKFSLIYRDMWQSTGKYQPRVDQLREIAPHIIDMGCFDRIETNGGAFEQVQLMFGENPNHAVREWTKPFNEAGIQTHMLERALNGLRMYPVPADVRRLMFRVKKAQGVNIARSFCGLNDHRNLELSIRYAKEAGMISQAALSITYSPVHTVEYYMGVVDKMVEYGADEICLKDMAGVGRPAMLGELVRQIKSKYSGIIVQYHGHSGPGMSVASMLEVARAGADYLDVAVEPLSWGMVHPDLIAIHSIMSDAGFEVKKINMDAYMKVRSLTQEFIDDFLGYFIDSRNKQMTSLLIGSGLPGGMMGSLMADLKGVHQGINTTLKGLGKPEISEDQLLVQLFREVEYIWPMLGYPPLVTPFSQYVKNVALMNIVQLTNGKERFGMIDNNTWDMVLGKAGKLPGQLDPVISELAEKDGKVFFEGTPQENYPDALPEFRNEMMKNGWDTGPDDEELFELAMHDRQYRDYKSGVAKTRFVAEIEGKRTELQENTTRKNNSNDKILVSEENGTVMLYVGSGEYYLGFYQEVEEGKMVKKGQRLFYIEAGRSYVEVLSDRDGTIRNILCKHGDFITKGTPIIEFV